MTGTLPLQVAIGPQKVEVTVHKQGPGSAALSKKSDQIARFVTDRIDFQHIEAIRTASAAEGVVAEMAAKELDQLEQNPEHQLAISKIEALQQPILDTLSASIQTLKQFLPEIKSVRVQIPA
ncbi:MAG TPA: hypothetical protein VLM38_15610 [Blastocatellia bacterium]|nr:hypothetical protein [Blastocatellia bacterium]